MQRIDDMLGGQVQKVISGVQWGDFNRPGFNGLIGVLLAMGLILILAIWTSGRKK